MEAPKSANGYGKRAGGGKSPYYVQPAKGGTFTVLHKAVGNRISPKVCGIMPSRPHAMALIKQLERAESAVDDLFLEATDDGIEALEAILEACCQSVLSRNMTARERGPARQPPAGGGVNPAERSGRRRSRGRGGRTKKPRGDQ